MARPDSSPVGPPGPAFGAPDPWSCAKSLEPERFGPRVFRIPARAVSMPTVPHSLNLSGDTPGETVLWRHAK
jgi:hypothetical protein